MKLHAIVVVLGIVALAGCGPAYTADLAGSNEKPTAVTTSATGHVEVKVDGMNIDVDGTYQGLSGAPSGAHIHGPADATMSASVVCALTATDGATAGTGTLKGECQAFDIAKLNENMFYVNVHTAANTGGEIRGQIMKH